MRHLNLDGTENKLIADIYKAALAPQLWCKVLTELRQLLGNCEVSLFFYDEQSQQRNFVIRENKIITNDCEENELQSDVYKIKQLLHGRAAGDVLTPCSVMHDDLLNIENYNNEVAAFTNKQQIQQLKAVVPLSLTNNICAVMGIYAANNATFINPGKMLFLQRFTPHIVRAIHIYSRLISIKQDQNLILETLKRMPLATFIVDNDLHVSFISPRANTLLSYHPALTLDRCNNLRAYHAQEQRQLETLCRDFISNSIKTSYTKSHSINIPLTHPKKIHPLKLCFAPVSAKQPVTMQVQNANFIVFANDPERPRLITAEYLQQAYDLSRSEAHIAQLSLQGLSINDIADNRNTGIETIRGHVKQVMKKTNTHSQAELVRLLTMLSGEFSRPTFKSSILEEASL